MSYIITFPDEQKLEKAQQAFFAHDNKIEIEVIRNTQMDGNTVGVAIPGTTGTSTPLPTALVVDEDQLSQFNLSDEETKFVSRVISGGGVALFVDSDDGDLVSRIATDNGGMMMDE